LSEKPCLCNDNQDFIASLKSLKSSAVYQGDSKTINLLDQAQTFYNIYLSSKETSKKEHYKNLSTRYFNLAQKEIKNFIYTRNSLTDRINKIKTKNQKNFDEQIFDFKTYNQIKSHIQRINFLIEKKDLINAESLFDKTSSLLNNQENQAWKYSRRVKESEELLSRAQSALTKALKESENFKIEKIQTVFNKSAAAYKEALKHYKDKNIDLLISKAKESIDYSDKTLSLINSMPYYEKKSIILINELINKSVDLFNNKTIDLKFAETVRNKIIEIQIFNNSEKYEEITKLAASLMAMINYYQAASDIPVDSMCKAIDRLEVPDLEEPSQTEDSSGHNPSGKEPDILQMINTARERAEETSKKALFLKNMAPVSNQGTDFKIVLDKIKIISIRAQNLMDRLKTNNLLNDIKSQSHTQSNTLLLDNKRSQIILGILDQCKKLKKDINSRMKQDFIFSEAGESKNTGTGTADDSDRNNDSNQDNDADYDLNLIIKKLNIMEKYLDYSLGIQ
jgi:hypothetical protein